MAGIAYQPEQLTERRSLALQGVSVELVRVPPVAHSFVHDSPAHLLMFFGRGRRADGESRAAGGSTSTMRDTSRKFSVIPANCHYEGWTIPTVPAEYLALSVDPAASFLEPRHGIAEICAAPRIYDSNLPPDVITTLGKLKRAFDSRDSLSLLYGETLVSLLMIEVLRWRANTTPKPATQSGLATWQARRSKELLDDHLDGEISIARLAQECGLSPSHFARGFKLATGLPPHRWLQHRRVDKAKDLLAHSTMRLAEIALACGFADQSHLGRVFGQVTGVTPSAWRRGHHARGGARLD